jgi:hypothetical protein
VLRVIWRPLRSAPAELGAWLPTAEEAVNDPTLSLDKPRDAVRFRRNNETPEPA